MKSVEQVTDSFLPRQIIQERHRMALKAMSQASISELVYSKQHYDERRRRFLPSLHIPLTHSYTLEPSLPRLLWLLFNTLDTHTHTRSSSLSQSYWNRLSLGIRPSFSSELDALLHVERAVNRDYPYLLTIESLVPILAFHQSWLQPAPTTHKQTDRMTHQW